MKKLYAILLLILLIFVGYYMFYIGIIVLKIFIGLVFLSFGLLGFFIGKLIYKKVPKPEKIEETKE